MAEREWTGGREADSASFCLVMPRWRCASLSSSSLLRGCMMRHFSAGEEEGGTARPILEADWSSRQAWHSRMWVKCIFETFSRELWPTLSRTKPLRKVCSVRFLIYFWVDADIYQCIISIKCGRRRRGGYYMNFSSGHDSTKYFSPSLSLLILVMPCPSWPS